MDLQDPVREPVRNDLHRATLISQFQHLFVDFCMVVVEQLLVHAGNRFDMTGNNTHVVADHNNSYGLVEFLENIKEISIEPPREYSTVKQEKSAKKDKKGRELKIRDYQLPGEMARSATSCGRLPNKGIQSDEDQAPAS